MASILVVEHARATASDLEQTLHALGHTVVEVVGSGGEAMARAEELRPDLLVVDAEMGGEPVGIAAATELRRRLQIPVVYLTSEAEEPDAERAKRTDAIEYVVKPYHELDLHSTIELALSRRAAPSVPEHGERWLSSLLRCIGDALVAVDPSGRVAFLNPAAERLLGWPSAEALRKPLAELVALLDVVTFAPIADPFAAALRERSVQSFDAVLVARRGEQRAVAASAAPIVEDGGHVLGAVLALRDVTQRNRLEARLALDDRLAALGTMAAGVAHEVNNPLSFVMTSVELVQTRLGEIGRKLEALPEATAAAQDFPELQLILDQALSGVERIRDVVHKLMRLSRAPDQGSGAVAVRPVLESAIQIAWSEIRHRARLIRHFQETPLVEADESRLGQLFLNLLLNAAQAIPDGHAEHHAVTIDTSTGRDGTAVVEVRDDGVGIPPEALPRIFEPFFTTKPVGSGSGLGLSICHGIVTSLGGSIEVESQPGSGSLFRVVLPAATARISEPAPPPPTAEPRRTRLLIIEDEAMLLEAFQAGLSKEHEVHGARDGREALQRFRDGERYEAILCDLMMPGMTGMEVHEQLDRIAPEQANRMIFMTGGTFTAAATEFLARVPNPCLSKPISMRTLRDAVRRRIADTSE
jgi:PAS domain S-box-containing protein